VQPVRVVTGGDEQRGGVVGTDTAAGPQRRAVQGDRVGDPLDQVVDFVGKLEDAPSLQPQGIDGRLVTSSGVAASSCAQRRMSMVVLGPDSASRTVGSAAQHGFELVDRLGTGLDGGGLGQLERPQHLHRPVTGLRAARGPAAEHRPGGGLGVEGVGLASPTAGYLVGLVDQAQHLDGLHVVVIIGEGLFPHRRPYRAHHPPRQLHLAKTISGIDRRSAPLLIEVPNLLGTLRIDSLWSGQPTSVPRRPR
jgi:hypothetical protein